MKTCSVSVYIFLSEILVFNKESLSSLPMTFHEYRLAIFFLVFPTCFLVVVIDVSFGIICVCWILYKCLV